MSPTWKKDLETLLSKKYSKKKADALIKKYKNAFPLSYQEDYSPNIALLDIQHIENLAPQTPLDIDFYQPTNDEDNCLHLRLFQLNKFIPLSDVLPLLENMDLKTFNERPYKLILDKCIVWISDFTVAYASTVPLEMILVKETFQDAFIQTQAGICENDGLNKLILGAKLSCREISILRAYIKYLQQTKFRFTPPYIIKTLTCNPAIAKSLIMLFKLKFDPKNKAPAKTIANLEAEIHQALDEIKTLDEDFILRGLWTLIQASLRTNFFQTQSDGQPKEYLSIKIKSDQVPELPLPHPLYEIFVYSPRFEAIHLRSTKVSRGGIRWSDRLEDFRTEILGLMKAQKVKNAIIVPSGAKGGFVLKRLPPQANRSETQSEVIACYKLFMCGLLDITDNLKKDKIIRPPQVVAYDEDDPYLVVAADKGTAAFSDIANNISGEYEFWLGDAFASGGSTGYDHKKMGITARGAWESIKRHFRELEIDINKVDFTVIGIGDMSGDVFGNGMMYTNHIKLVAAFDHRDIFIDPNPDPKTSYQERVRLFNVPNSSWQDYNTKLISKGGGVYSRNSKSIPLTSEAKELLGLEVNSLTPNELIRAILKAKVDLLFNGGIGTYVKATQETQAEVGDRSNEYTRVNGDELRCRVVGEGGNLGFTQLGRIEYALKGGLINTDFIDNSGGVDCSDHEVNLKILLDKEVIKHRITEKERNQLLVSMTNEVAELVLHDNYTQAFAMSLSIFHSAKYLGLYQNYITELEAKKEINREVEFLPDDREILARKAAGMGLTRPELAVLLAYTKIHIKNEVLKSNLTRDSYFNQILESSFPKALHPEFNKAIQEHSLRNELIVTQLSNRIVNNMGITFVYRLQTETGATVAEIVRAYTIASKIFDTHPLEKLIESLDFKVSVSMQYDLLHHIRHLINISTRWFLRGTRLQADTTTIIEHYSQPIKVLKEIIPELMMGATRSYLESLSQQFISAGLPQEIAHQVATTRAIYTSLTIIEIATENDFDLIKTAKVYFAVGEHFNLIWFRDQIAADTREGHWINLARLTLRDELDFVQKTLTIAIMQFNKNNLAIKTIIDKWIALHKRPVERWNRMMEMLHSSSNVDYSMFFIALKEFAELVYFN